MAIHFARCQFIQRSRGNSATRVAAYNARAVVTDRRTGERHDATRWAGDIEHHEVVMPDGAMSAWTAATLANTAEAAERRRDARVGREFVLALPHELSAKDRLALAHSFVNEHFVSKGLPAQLDIHRPHPNSKNHHAHVWVPMRRLEGDRFAAKQATDLLPLVRKSHYGVFVSEAELWGQLWTIHQERYFYDRKLDHIVDPVAPVGSSVSYGPRRSWGLDPAQSHAAATIAARGRHNAEVARDPELVYQIARQQKFDSRAVSRFLEKFVDDAEERTAVGQKVQTLRRADLEKDRWADRVPSGWRALTVQDIARELSPEYDKLLRRADEIIHKTVPKDQWVIDQQEGDLRLAEYRLVERKGEMGWVRRSLHAAHLREDRELKRWDDFKGRVEHTLWAWQAHRAAHRGEWNTLIRRADIAFEEVRSKAEQKLREKQKIAQEARELLDTNQSLTINRRRTHTLRSGP